MHPLWKTFPIRENNSSWLNKYVRRLLTVMLSIGNNRFLGVKRLGKPLGKDRNTSIHRLESNGKFWIVIWQKKSRKRSHNTAFSKIKSSFSDRAKIILFDMNNRHQFWNHLRVSVRHYSKSYKWTPLKWIITLTKE